MPSAASSTLADVARALESLGVRWYLFGAQAAIHYGSPRVTADVDMTVPIASPNDIVVMKMLAGRAKDLEDLVGILRAAPDRLDVEEVRALLSQLEQILGQSDMLPPFDDALRRAGIRQE